MGRACDECMRIRVRRGGGGGADAELHAVRRSEGVDTNCIVPCSSSSMSTESELTI
jgi:hypothetical protein